jgi:integrase
MKKPPRALGSDDLSCHAGLASFLCPFTRAAGLDEHGRARLSYEQASQIFKRASKGATLHQLRHSALTHAAEEGTSTPMLMAKSGHTSVRRLAKYARVSFEALARYQDEHDPASRRYHH